MKLPKRGTKVEDLKCKLCSRKSRDQPEDIRDCVEKKCPFNDVKKAKDKIEKEKKEKEKHNK